MVNGYWLLVIGYSLLVIGYWLLVIGYWLLVIGYWLLGGPLSIKAVFSLFCHSEGISIIVAILFNNKRDSF
jgi:hypothetical protein